jgi:hypothetical protein
MESVEDVYAAIAAIDHKNFKKRQLSLLFLCGLPVLGVVALLLAEKMSFPAEDSSLLLQLLLLCSVISWFIFTIFQELSFCQTLSYFDALMQNGCQIHRIRLVKNNKVGDYIVCVLKINRFVVFGPSGSLHAALSARNS